MKSVHEQIVDRVWIALSDAGIAGGRVHRNAQDGLSDDALPALNIVRGPSESIHHGNGLEKHTFSFDIEHIVSGDDAETVADAIHMECHALLFSAPSPLADLVRQLRCQGTEMAGDAADIVSCRLVAHYQCQFLTRTGDLTRPI